MIRPRRRTIYLSSNAAPLTMPPPLLPPGVTGPIKVDSHPAGVEALPPSPFQTTVAASGSIGLIGLTVSLSLGVSPQFVPLAACLPWLLYAIGKSIFLVILLFSDVAALFGGDESPQILPTVKEE